MDTLNMIPRLDELGATPVAIGGVQFDALLDIAEKFDATVPMFRNDSGKENTDDIIPNLLRVEMKLFVTPTPVTWRGIPSHNGRNPREVLDALRELMEKRKPVFVTTVKKNYDNMMIQKVSSMKTADIGYALEIDISMVQLTHATYNSYAIPERYEMVPSVVVSEVIEVGSEDGMVDFSAFAPEGGGGR